MRTIPRFLTDIRNFGTLLALLAVVILIIGARLQHQDNWSIQAIFIDMWGNLSSELASIAVTILVIDGLNQRRQAEQEERQEKIRLIQQLGSTINQESKRAAEELTTRGWLSDKTLENADVSRANLREIDFKGANFVGANLSFSDLQGANLTDVNLSNATLDNADLSGATLQNTKFDENTSLKRVRLAGAILSGQIPDIWLDSLTLLTRLRTQEADLSGRDFSYFDISEIDLSGKELRETIFYETRALRSDFHDSNLQDANLWQADLGESNLENCNLQNANLCETNLQDCKMAQANLHDANLMKANLMNAELVAADLTRANLRDANLNNADLNDAIGLNETQLKIANRLRGCRMPDGRLYQGQYQLKGDLEDAKLQGYDIDNNADMQRFYEG